MLRPVYFASGSNRPADIRGFASVGHPIGVAAPEVSPAAELELVRSSVPVFVDSGAFSEVVFEATGVRVVKPITDAEWRKRLALYRRLAVAMGPRVSIVAPDRIADQEETLRRLALYAPELRELRALGARILVPVQKGTRTQAAFVREVVLVLGFDDFVHAIPSKKQATTMVELAAYVAEVKPRAVHLLGLGIRNASAPAALAILAEVDEVSLDSNLIAARVGRGAAPRILTRARDHAARILARNPSPKTVQELGILVAFTERCGSRRCAEERSSGLPGCDVCALHGARAPAVRTYAAAPEACVSQEAA